MRRTHLLAVAAALSAAPAFAQSAAAFPFVLPWDDATPSVTNVSSLNPAPLDASRALTARDGHFYDTTGRRVRFLAVNVTASSCFPDHATAEKMAARLHKYGVNMVRLHHMDSGWPVPGIFYFDSQSSGKPTLKLNPESMERLCYLLYQFKQQGIYANINLHVGRSWSIQNGFADGDKLPEMGKVLSYSEPRAIELEHEYARQLLTWENPYTKSRIGDDPGVAVVELTNEDTLVGHAGQLSTLPPAYFAEFEQGFNAFLKQKYGTTEKLRGAWNAEAEPLGASLVTNGQFADGSKGWVLEHQGTTNGELSTESATGQTNAPEGRVLHVHNLRTDNTDWHVQLHFTGMNLEPGKLYTVRFMARAGKPRSMSVGTRYDIAPWSDVGLSQGVQVTSNWQRFTFTFRAQNPAPNHTRLSFVLGNDPTDVYLGDVALQPGGGGVKLTADESLEKGTIRIPPVGPFPPGQDFMQYLMDTELTFAEGLRDYIHNDLHVAKAVTCSQASYGNIAGVWRESHMDFVDMHSYWQHPGFPGRAFDPNDFRIQNTPMVKSPDTGTFGGLLMHRVADKPFTISEYDHPAPSEWAAEEVPMMFSYAAWQDVDGVYLFAYDINKTDHIDGFFDVAGHPGKMAFLPAAAQLFLAGDLEPTPASMTLTVPGAKVAQYATEWPGYGFWGAVDASVTERDFLDRRPYVTFSSAAGKPGVTRQGTPPATPPVVWDHEKNLYTVDTPAAKVVVGFLGGSSIDLSGTRVAMAPTPRNFVSLTITSMDEQPIASSAHVLLTTMDKAENPGLQWNADRTFAAHAWDKGPVEITTVPLTITLPRSAPTAVWSLDERGQRKAQIPSTLDAGKLTFKTGPADQTVWYELAAPGQ